MSSSCAFLMERLRNPLMTSGEIEQPVPSTYKFADYTVSHSNKYHLKDNLTSVMAEFATELGGLLDSAKVTPEKEMSAHNDSEFNYNALIVERNIWSTVTALRVNLLALGFVIRPIEPECDAFIQLVKLISDLQVFI